MTERDFTSVLDKFQRRDIRSNAALDDLVYIQFAKRYTSSNKEPREGELKSQIVERNWKKEKHLEVINKHDIIVTHTHEIEKFYSTLPKVIKINNLKPGEP